MEPFEAAPPPPPPSLPPSPLVIVEPWVTLSINQYDFLNDPAVSAANELLGSQLNCYSGTFLGEERQEKEKEQRERDDRFCRGGESIPILRFNQSTNACAKKKEKLVPVKLFTQLLHSSGVRELRRKN